MKSQAAIHKQLNAVLGASLIAINQYFMHARMLRRWGLGGLGKQLYEQSIEEMKMSDKLVQRIFLLDGLPNLQDLGKLLLGEDAQEALECDLRLEQKKHQTLVDAIAFCEAEQDYVSRALLVELKDENEEHMDWLETQLDLIEDLGLQNYLQSQIG